MKFKFIILSILLSLCAVTAQSQTRLSVEGSGKLYPLAVPQLCARNGFTDGAGEVARIIAQNMSMSGFFSVMDPDYYIESPGKCHGINELAYSDWTVLGVDGLVKGEIERFEDDTISLKLYLYDIQIRKIELAKEYKGRLSDLRAIAHRFSNEILRYFTGEFGPFGTKIAFSRRIGRFKELYAMDLDGANLQQLTNDHSLAMSASWSPSGREILFTTFKDRQPDLFNVNVYNGQRKRLSNSFRQELGGNYSPDGSQIIIAESEGLKTELFLLNSEGKRVRKVTSNYSAIDVSPSWSPDGNRLVFTSNRTGNPQIYTMDTDGRSVRRISYVASNYCTSPVWSPRGDKLAFVCRSENRHHLFVTNTDGSSPVQLTTKGTNEDPSWSPDGRYLIFATTAFSSGVYNLAMIRADGVNLTQVTNFRQGAFDPAWSSWLEN